MAVTDARGDHVPLPKAFLRRSGVFAACSTERAHAITTVTPAHSRSHGRTLTLRDLSSLDTHGSHCGHLVLAARVTRRGLSHCP